MTDYEKTSIEYLDAWRTSHTKMQELRDMLNAEKERVSLLRDTLTWIDNRCYKDAEMVSMIDTVMQATGQVNQDSKASSPI